MAPEIVAGRGKAFPNTQSDRYSLAVILFLILCGNHPLEGKRWLVPCMTDAHVEKLYGTEPIFIYDPNDDSNGPVKNIHSNVITRWGYMPQFIRDAFLKAFSQEALKNPDRRLRDFDWISVLVRFRSDIVKCRCGNEVFVNDYEHIICDCCGEKLPQNLKHLIKLPKYSLLAVKGTSIFRCQLGVCDIENALDPIGVVIQAKDAPDKLGFKNLTGHAIIGFSSSGKEKEVKPDEIVPIKNRIKLVVLGKTIEFQEFDMEGMDMG